MYEEQRRIARAVDLTRVIRSPKQRLATFGVTDLRYYVVTEPAYREIDDGEDEAVVRDGRVTAQKPDIVTPGYMLNLEGFSEEVREYMQRQAEQFGVNSPGILYKYRNEPGGLEIVNGHVRAVAERIGRDLDERGVETAVVLSGLDELWDVSLFKFIYDYTAQSSESNAREMEAMGLLDPVPPMDVPRGAIQRIEELFQQVKQGQDPGLLHKELVRWGLFEHYEARFLGLFRK